jgi:hypothetical protein
MKEWKCVEVNSYMKISSTIRDHELDGWILHTYSTTGCAGTIHHYLLFERELEKSRERA